MAVDPWRPIARRRIRTQQRIELAFGHDQAPIAVERDSEETDEVRTRAADRAAAPVLTAGDERALAGRGDRHGGMRRRNLDALVTKRAAVGSIVRSTDSQNERPLPTGVAVTKNGARRTEIGAYRKGRRTKHARKAALGPAEGR